MSLLSYSQTLAQTLSQKVISQNSIPKFRTGLLFLALGLLVSLSTGCRQPDHIQLDPRHPRVESLSSQVVLSAKVMSGEHHHVKKDVSWSSKNEDVVTVDSKGVVTPVGPGQGTVVARYGSLVAEVVVDVDTVVGLEIDAEEVLLDYDEVRPQKPEIRVLGYGNRVLRGRRPSYTSADAKICRVDGRGQFWPGNRGETSITVTAGAVSQTIKCRVE